MDDKGKTRTHRKETQTRDSSASSCKRWRGTVGKTQREVDLGASSGNPSQDQQAQHCREAQRRPPTPLASINQTTSEGSKTRTWGCSSSEAMERVLLRCHERRKEKEQLKWKISVTVSLSFVALLVQSRESGPLI